MSNSIDNTAYRKGKIVEVVISLKPTSRGTESAKDWKVPFKELKFGTVRAEQEWALLLKVDDEHANEVYALADGRFQVETVVELPEEDLKKGDKEGSQ